MGLFLDYVHTDFLARMLTDFTDFYYNFLPEMVGFTLTLGFASCLHDFTDKTERTDSPTGAACLTAVSKPLSIPYFHQREGYIVDIHGCINRQGGNHYPADELKILRYPLN